MLTTRSLILRRDSYPRVQQDLRIYVRHNNPPQVFSSYTIAEKKTHSSVSLPSIIPATTYLMPHNTLLILRTPRIPFHEITLSALSTSGIREVQKDSSEPTSTFDLIPAGNFANQNEFLGGGIGDRHECPRTDFNPKVECFPIGQFSKMVKRCANSNEDVPILAHVRSIGKGIDPILIVNSDDNAPLIPKLIFMCLLPDHLPSQSSIITQECITFFIFF